MAAYITKMEIYFKINRYGSFVFQDIKFEYGSPYERGVVRAFFINQYDKILNDGEHEIKKFTKSDSMPTIDEFLDAANEAAKEAYDTWIKLISTFTSLNAYGHLEGHARLTSAMQRSSEYKRFLNSSNAYIKKALSKLYLDNAVANSCSPQLKQELFGSIKTGCLVWIIIIIAGLIASLLERL